MKKIIPLIITASFVFFSTPAWANTYKARCLDTQDELTRCQVNLEGETLSIKYNSEEHQGLNLTLPVNRITSVSSESYRGQRNFWTGDRGEYMGVSIEYLNEQNQKKVAIVQFKQREGFIFKTKLEPLVNSEDQPSAK